MLQLAVQKETKSPFSGSCHLGKARGQEQLAHVQVFVQVLEGPFSIMGKIQQTKKSLNKSE